MEKKTCNVSQQVVHLHRNILVLTFLTKALTLFQVSRPVISQTACTGSHLNHSYLAPDVFLCLSQLELNLLPFSSLFFQASDLAPVSAATAFSSSSTEMSVSCATLLQFTEAVKYSIFFLKEQLLHGCLGCKPQAVSGSDRSNGPCSEAHAQEPEGMMQEDSCPVLQPHPA